ncbi:MAG: hypothetical protein ACYSWP_02465 [Planctomycetota bacterium]|jgi:hypothetical protein
MAKKKSKFRSGITIIEVAVAAMASVIVMVGVGIAIVDGQRGWNRMYSRTYADVVTDSYVARKMFDTAVRKSSREMYLIDDAGQWVEVYYYSSPGASEVDRYARFSVSSGDLNVEYGELDPRSTSSVQTVCSNVSSASFSGTGTAIQMILNLDDGSQSATVTCSAVMHNQ